ncbi:MAG: leucine-rich repeat protein [Clostridia bacterium]|nr:leucine-rich repeat protein [Clostridia bacterium]
MAKHSRLTRAITLCVLIVIMLSSIFTVYLSASSRADYGASPSIQKINGGSIYTGIENFYDSTVLYKLPDTIKADEEISLIINLDSITLLDAFNNAKTDGEFKDFALTDEAGELASDIRDQSGAIVSALQSAGIDFELGHSYNTVLAGFEITITAEDFPAVCKAVGDRARVVVGEVYNTADTELVENNVDVKDTGIFNSESFGYDGTGMLVAVLDTGLDYYHSAFSTENFTADRGKLHLTFNGLSAIMADKNMSAEGRYPGLTASDVYISEKVPFGFDYADSDPDVFPIHSNHGTHVAGIIAGGHTYINDEELDFVGDFVGVAPNAQLAIMKIFSDIEDTARTSWIVAALEDCVNLGVDVINMSIGTSCGFSRETDAEVISGVYEKIRQQGISMVVAASNSYSSAYGSDKNGSYPLTSNPDSSTVGSPSTYLGTMSVASIQGAKTPYITFNGKIMYFTESTDRYSKEKKFFDEILGSSTEKEFDFVVLKGLGYSSDYSGVDVKGKIVVIKRGVTTFEEKANVAEKMGAAGVIIYNNVSGEIKMNAGDTDIPLCSISQDDGEALAAVGKGKITISKNNTAGPFMSDFSSWGPTPELGIKPEITAHGGSILSAVPGGGYDRISGTSMACPNIAGVTALLRQFVKESFPNIANDSVEINKMVNRLMMSTADIILNKNGLPYAVRKQGAGLANLTNCKNTASYLVAYNQDGTENDKPKIELGDDPTESGVYKFKFDVVNFSDSAQSYKLNTIILTESVSDTKTSHGETTVSEMAYELSGKATYTVNGEKSTTVSVDAGATKTVEVTITLSAADKKYLRDSFENGMYVEGFVTLDSSSGVDLSLPYLAFFGDWTVAPIFDLDYFETNKDELDDGIDMLDKNLPDAFSSRPIGGTNNDYLSYLGSYYFDQNPNNPIIAADRNHISLSNQSESINSLRFVWAGMLRNAERVDIVIVEDSTGEVVFETTDEKIRKAHGEGGPIQAANIDIEFSAIEHNLKNNTAYTVTLKAHLFDGEESENNLKDTFSFPLVTDFEAPSLTGCEFYTEYDRSAKKNRLYVKMAVYDNHYAMSMQMGYLGLPSDPASEFTRELYTFDKYLTPIYSERNSTTYVTYELTDYLEELSTSVDYYENITNRAFTVICYDYALNASFFEVELPDDFRDAAFDIDRGDAVAGEDADIVLRPNEVLDLTSPDVKNKIHTLVYPNDQWAELLEFESTNTKVCRVVGNKVIAVGEGGAAIRIKLRGADSSSIETRTLYIEVSGRALSKPSVDYFKLTGFYVDYAHYLVNTEDRKIGKTGDTIKFPDGKSYYLTLYPGESVTAQYKLISYFPEDVEVWFESADSNIVTVDENGKITAKSEGSSQVTIKVRMDGKNTLYSQAISIEVKEPWITQGPALTAYYGAGGKIVFPERLAITDINQFAFANYDYVLKEPWEEVSEEAPGLSKVWYYGDKRPDLITEVIIPEGIKKIGSYAFAGLTGLTKVVLPSTLETIDYGAFYGCTSLKTVEGIENVKFINQRAFEYCDIAGSLNLRDAIAVSDYAFASNKNLTSISLGDKLQSIGAHAFENNSSAESITIASDIVKLGAYVFSGCSALTEMSVNSAVIPTGAFNECASLTSITIGRDVAVIGEYAFKGTKIASFEVDGANTVFTASDSGDCLMSGDAIVLIAPTLTSFENTDATEVLAGAFSGNVNLISVNLPSVTSVGGYAFAHCQNLESLTLGALSYIGNSAFMNTKISTLPAWSADATVGEFAFADTALTEVVIPDGFTVPNGCFLNCKELATVVIGDNVTIGEEAFALGSDNLRLEEGAGGEYYYCVIDSPLVSLTIGDNCYLGASAFYNATALTTVTIGNGATIGDFAFYNAQSLREIDLEYVEEIGASAFSGDIYYVYSDANGQVPKLDNSGNYSYTYFSTKLTDIDLSALKVLGESAFAYSNALTTVTLGEDLKVIPNSAFLASAVNSVNGIEGILEIGDYAFSECPITGEIKLHSIEKVGKYAFGHNDAITAVSFPTASDGVEIMEGAFVYCENLVTLNNTASLTEIGDFAFAITGVTSADLSSVVSLGRQAFYKNEVCEFTVTISDKLNDIGDNPFANCIIAPFKTTASESFGQNDYVFDIYTYELNENIRIIDGSIYRIVPAGLELITYTGGASAQIPEGVVRISDMAFAGSDIVFVTLPESLRAIGHKAFYGCARLALVTFLSYNAPILEEEYDEAYFASLQNIPASGSYLGYVDNLGNPVAVEGLGIIPYYMLNADFSPTNIFYGATFVDYIGHIENKIAMVRPVNARGYETFIFGQYFGSVIDGGAVKDAVTADAIEAISKLPSKITLADKELVLAARAAYNKILTNLQKSLVTNYSMLESAEKTISDLEYIQNQNKPETPDTPTTPDVPDTPPTEEDTKDYTVLILSVSLGVAALVIISLLIAIVYTTVKRKRPRTKVVIRFNKEK